MDFNFIFKSPSMISNHTNGCFNQENLTKQKDEKLNWNSSYLKQRGGEKRHNFLYFNCL